MSSEIERKVREQIEAHEMTPSKDPKTELVKRALSELQSADPLLLRQTTQEGI